MADKRSIRRDIKKLQRVKTWQLLILLILAGFLSATFLRLNNTGMVQRRNAVTAADKVGGAQQIAERIAELQRYSTAHMNMIATRRQQLKRYQILHRKALPLMLAPKLSVIRSTLAGRRRICSAFWRSLQSTRRQISLPSQSCQIPNCTDTNLYRHCGRPTLLGLVCSWLGF